MTSYKLQNISTGRIFDDTGWLLADPEASEPSLVRAVYQNKQFTIDNSKDGFYKFSNWLPICRTLENSAPTITYKSTELAKALGLSNLYISFSGYWPEKGAKMTTCSFKETEAYSVCARFIPEKDRIMVVASAGNTARAFARVCSENSIPLVVCIPEDNIDALWFEKPLAKCVKIVCTPKKTDYFDAIDLANKICKSPRFFEEGGAKNVARRDGMATTLLSAVSVIGKIPDYYFQAIGSGTGTIAVWEANLRLLEDGRFGNHKMRLIPSQNYPFTPMYDAWKAGSRALLPFNDDEARDKALQIKAKVLSNRRPPYSVPGGLFDALTDTNGDIEYANNQESEEACELFRKTEGIDIYHASGIAIAGMIKSINSGKVDKDKVIMLNVTGGGEERFKSTHNVALGKPDLIIDNRTDVKEIYTAVEKLF
jgi:cysteate synthase